MKQYSVEVEIKVAGETLLRCYLGVFDEENALRVLSTYRESPIVRGGIALAYQLTGDPASAIWVWTIEQPNEKI